MRESCSASLKLVADLLYLASQPKVTARAYGGKSGSYGFDHKSLRPQRRWHRADRFRATSTPLVLHATVQQFLAVFHQLRAYMLRPARTGAGSLLSRDRLSLKLDCAESLTNHIHLTGPRLTGAVTSSFKEFPYGGLQTPLGRATAANASKRRCLGSGISTYPALHRPVWNSSKPEPRRIKFNLDLLEPIRSDDVTMPRSGPIEHC